MVGLGGMAAGALLTWCIAKQPPPPPAPIEIVHALAPNRFAGKVCVVTGAASGLGLATAERLVAEGGRVLLSDLNQVALDAAVARLAAESRAAAGAASEWVSPVAGMAADVSDRVAAEKVVAKAEALWGRLDVLVNSVSCCSERFHYLGLWCCP